MGKLMRNLKKSARSNEPLFALKEITDLYNKYHSSDQLSLEDVAYDIHLSDITLYKIKIANTNGITDLNEFSSKEKKTLAKALHASYESLKRPPEDKVDKFRKIANLKAKEQGQKLTMRSYTLVPLNFCEEEKSVFLFENLRWIFDVLAKKERNWCNDLTSYGLQELWNKFYSNNQNIYNDLFANGKEFESFESELVNIKNMVDNYYTDLMSVNWKLFLTIVGYLYGINSTFLEGKHTYPTLFEGLGGVDFRIEHIRMKLLYLLDNDKLQYNREKLVCAITCPYENLDVLKEICDENGIDIKALQGMPRPLLKDDSEDIRNYTNTMKFKSCLKNAENFIFKPKPAEI